MDQEIVQEVRGAKRGGGFSPSSPVYGRNYYFRLGSLMRQSLFFCYVLLAFLAGSASAHEVVVNLPGLPPNAGNQSFYLRLGPSSGPFTTWSTNNPPNTHTKTIITTAQSTYSEIVWDASPFNNYTPQFSGNLGQWNNNLGQQVTKNVTFNVYIPNGKYTIQVHNEGTEGGNVTLTAISTKSGQAPVMVSGSAGPGGTAQLQFAHYETGSYLVEVEARVQRVIDGVLTTEDVTIFRENFNRTDLTDITRHSYFTFQQRNLQDLVFNPESINDPGSMDLNPGATNNLSSVGPKRTNPEDLGVDLNDPNALAAKNATIGADTLEAISKLSNQLGELKNQGATNNTSLNGIGTKLDAIGTGIDGVKTGVNTMTNQLGTVTNQLGAATNQLGNVTNQLGKLTNTNGLDDASTTTKINNARSRIGTQETELGGHRDTFTGVTDHSAGIVGGSPLGVVTFGHAGEQWTVDLDPFKNPLIAQAAAAVRTFIQYILALGFLTWASRIVFDSVAAGLRTASVSSNAGGAIPGASSAVGVVVGVSIVVLAGGLFVYLMNWLTSKGLFEIMSSNPATSMMSSALWIADQVFPVALGLSLGVSALVLISMAGFVKTLIAYVIKAASI